MIVGILLLIAFVVLKTGGIISYAYPQVLTQSPENSEDLNYYKIGDDRLELIKTPLGVYLKSSFSDIGSFDCSEKNHLEVVYLYFFTKGIKERNILRSKCPQFELGKAYFLNAETKKTTNLETTLRFYFSGKNKKKLHESKLKPKKM